MRLRNSDQKYGAITQSFHWVMALLIIGMLIIGHVMQGMEGMNKIKIYGLHKSTGILILFLVFLRFGWQQINYQPSIPDSKRINARLFKLMGFAANVSHYLIYLLIFLMPLTGWLFSSGVGFPTSFYGLFTMPNLIEPSKPQADFFRELHGIFAWVLIALLCAHIGAALFHNWFLKDNVLKRMLPVLLVLIASPAWSEVPEYKIDKTNSSLKFEAVENGAKVTGNFKDFSGDVLFNPDDLVHSKADAQISVISVDSSYDEMSSTLKGDEWFAVKSFPLAKFQVTNFVKSGGDYIAMGNLTIRDKTVVVPVKFKLVQYDAKHAVIDGAATLSRNAFGVGQGEWKATGVVKDEVVVTLHIAAVAQ